MSQNSNKKPFFIRVELRDQRAIDWYKAQPKKSKSQAVTHALVLGIPLTSEDLDTHRQAICDLDSRLQVIENWCQTIVPNLVDQNLTIELLEQRIDKLS